MIEDKEKSDSQENLNQVMNNAGLSPQAITKGKKGKVKFDKPTKSSAKREAKTYHS